MIIEIYSQWKRTYVHIMRSILPQGPFLSNIQSQFSFSSTHLLFLRAAVREAACSPCTFTSLATWHCTQHGQRKEAQQSQQQFPWESQEGSVTSQVSNSFTPQCRIWSWPSPWTTRRGCRAGSSWGGNSSRQRCWDCWHSGRPGRGHTRYRNNLNNKREGGARCWPK